MRYPGFWSAFCSKNAVIAVVIVFPCVRINRAKYPTLDVAKAEVFDYTERFHNPRMRRRVARQDRKLSDLFKPSAETG
jgi:hypothetical protein